MTNNEETNKNIAKLTEIVDWHYKIFEVMIKVQQQHTADINYLTKEIERLKKNNIAMWN